MARSVPPQEPSYDLSCLLEFISGALVPLTFSNVSQCFERPCLTRTSCKSTILSLQLKTSLSRTSATRPRPRPLGIRLRSDTRGRVSNAGCTSSKNQVIIGSSTPSTTTEYIASGIRMVNAGYPYNHGGVEVISSSCRAVSCASFPLVPLDNHR